MKFSTSTLASLGGFVAVVSAAASPDYQQTVWCTDKTVTQTVIVTVGVGGPSPPQPTPYVQDKDMQKSVDYSFLTTSTLCPGQGKYPNPQIKGASIDCGMTGWTSYIVPYTTVYAWPTGSGDSKKNCNVVVYQGTTIIKVEIVDITVTIVDGKTTTVTVTKDGKPTYTPPPVSTTVSAPYSQKTLKVVVGGLKDGKPDLTFKPNNVDAKIGDIVELNFLAANHTLTQSEFLTPCTFNKQFDTGFNQFNPNSTDGLKVVRYEVKSEKPLWFYCKQPVGNHCGKGMVFGINAGGKMDQFIKNAIAQNGAPTQTGTASIPPPTGMAAPLKVTVGTDGGKGLRFDPPYLQNVKRGDKIVFDFRKQNHTLTESSFDKPCTKLNSNAFDTNFKNVNVDDKPGFSTVTFTVDSDGERYFYCRQANGTPNGHCSAGMVFAINVDQERFGKFQSAAKATLPAPKIKGRSPSF
ncbi:MAG: hypothetical protein M1839_004254 [Geoglossum umbratile]|nr:MAG: hypothetical protein M1839_004254 [Geoglossum umbratile]